MLMLFSAIEIQKLQDRIPAQVDRQQPVYFEDAHGRIAPFHVEFVNSLKVHYQNMSIRGSRRSLKVGAGFSGYNESTVLRRAWTQKGGKYGIYGPRVHVKEKARSSGALGLCISAGKKGEYEHGLSPTTNINVFMSWMSD